MEPNSTEPKIGSSERLGTTPDIRMGESDRRIERLSGKAEATTTPSRRRIRPAMLLAGCAALVGLSSLAASGWIYGEMRREMLRVSTEMAQVRLSLDLYAQRSGQAPVAAAEGSGLEELANRLAILEGNWRSGGEQPAAASTPSALPPIGETVSAAADDADCLPSGMRLLVAAGDTYPVCGTDAIMQVMTVSNGYITLTDGTTVPSGGAVPLVGTACMIGVTSGGDEATTGFAEIRVSC